MIRFFNRSTLSSSHRGATETVTDESVVLNVTSGQSYSYLESVNYIRELTTLNVNSQKRTRKKVDLGFSNYALLCAIPEQTFTPLNEGIKKIFNELADLGLEFSKNISDYQDTLFVTEEEIRRIVNNRRPQGTPKGTKIPTKPWLILCQKLEDKYDINPLQLD